MSTPTPDALIGIVQALVDDEHLGEWFESLQDAPSSERAAELRSMAARMGMSGPFAEVAQATALLALPGVYESVLGAFRELRGET